MKIKEKEAKEQARKELKKRKKEISLKLKKHIHKHHEKLKDLRIFFHFRYPKTLILIISIIFAYFLFSNPIIDSFISKLNSLEYLGIFISGIFLSFGFLSAFSAGFFIASNTDNILIAAIIGGIGGMIGDLIVFNFIHISFKDEFAHLKKTNIIQNFNQLLEKDLGHKIKIYLLYAFSGLFILSPLPDELGITMLAGLTRIKQKPLALISFILHVIGILILLWL